MHGLPNPARAPARLALLLACLGTGGVAAHEPTGAFYPTHFYPAAADRGSAIPVALEPGASSSPLVLEPHASGGSIRLRVLEQETAMPIQGLLMEARVGAWSAVARTGGDGVATIEGVPAGVALVLSRPDDPRSGTGAFAVRYHPGVSSPQGATLAHVVDGEITVLSDLPLPTAARIHWRVSTPEGFPWITGTVHLRSLSTAMRTVRRTDTAGIARFSGLDPGDYSLWIDARGSPFVSVAWDGSRDTLAAPPIPILRGEVRSLAITIDRGGGLRGVIRHRDTNRGLPDLEVLAFRPERPDVRFRSRTDALGFYTIPGLASGFYKVHVPAIRRYFPDARTVELARSVAVVEPAFTEGIDLKGDPGGACELLPESAGAISGFVRASFETMERARILVWGPVDTIAQELSAGGSYTIGCIPPGAYRIALHPDGVYRTQYHPKTNSLHEALWIQVAAGDTTMAVDFEPELGVTIRGSVLDARTGIALASMPILCESTGGGGAITIRTFSSEDGSFQVDRLVDGTALPAGAWIVGTDSIVVHRVETTYAPVVRLSGEQRGSAIRLRFDLPGELAVQGWQVERRANDSTIEVLASAGTHPAGLHAREHLDTEPWKGTKYRLRIEIAGGRGEVASDWIDVPYRPERGATVYPNPWTGSSPLHLALASPIGRRPEIFSPDGSRLGTLDIGGDGGLRLGTGRLPPGVYYLRWWDESGGPHTGPLVLCR